MLAAALFLSAAFAQAPAPCDAKALSAALTAAAPIEAPRAFAALATCDAKAAKAAAKAAFPRFLSGEDADRALVLAIKLGEGAVAASWIDAQLPDERSRAIASLGPACKDDPAVQAWFVERRATLGDAFWSQRWYRALATCPAESVQAILWSELDKGAGADRARYFGVLQTAAAGSGAGAGPELTTLLSAATDPEIQSQIIQAYGLAAGLGSVAGLNGALAEQGAAAIVAAAPRLQSKAVDQARLTLGGLGAEAAADGLVVSRYKERVQPGGGLLYGAIAIEDAVCKGDKPQQRVHVAAVQDPGRTWPDQLADKVKGATDGVWTLDLPSRCKGTGGTTWALTPEPVADEAALKAWADAALKAAAKPGVKTVRIDAAPLKI